MKVYVATSNKNWQTARLLGQGLREIGHEVYVFCDEHTISRKASLRVQGMSEAKNWDAKQALDQPLVRTIFSGDMKEFNTCDCVLLFLPSGKSAHVEAGIMKGRGNSVIVYGYVTPGDWDTVYLAFDKFFVCAPGTDRDESGKMIQWFRERSPKKNDSNSREKRSTTKKAS